MRHDLASMPAGKIKAIMTEAPMGFTMERWHSHIAEATGVTLKELRDAAGGIYNKMGCGVTSKDVDRTPDPRPTPPPATTPEADDEGPTADEVGLGRRRKAGGEALTADDIRLGRVKRARCVYPTQDEGEPFTETRSADQIRLGVPRRFRS